jgi:hypothetical protein
MTCYIRDLCKWHDGSFGPHFRADHPMDMVIITSSAEVGVLAEPLARSIIAATAGPAFVGEQSFVSVGCAGVYAAILEFLRSDAQTARILALEAPRDHVQQRLDAAGLGPDGAGFIAQEVACLMEVSRRPEGLAIPINHCEILARPASMGGTATLAGMVSRRLAELQLSFPGLAIVDFQNVSDWARGLATLVRGACPTGGRRWLGSIETDNRHYMSARPLLDLMRLAGSGPLLVGCLGAGGRLGLMVAGGDGTRRPWPEVERRCHATTILSAAESAAPLYMDRAFFGRSNFYFHWSLTHDFYASA